MKRFFYTALAGALLLSLVGCGSGDTTHPSSVDAPAVTTAAPSAAPSETDSPAPEPEAANPETVSLLKYTTYDYTTSESGNTQLLSGSCDALMLGGEDAKKYPALSEAISAFSDRTVTKWQADYAMTAEAAAGYLKDQGHTYGKSNINDYVTVRRADNRVVSIVITRDYYAGGAHPSYAFSSVNISSADGSIISIGDIFGDTEALAEIISAKLNEKYDSAMFFDDPYKTVKAEITEEKIVWTLDSEGVTFWFSPYELAPYACGSFYVVIPFSEIDSIPESYCEAPDAWACEFNPYGEILTYADGQEYSISTYGTSTDNVGYSKLSVTINGETSEKDSDYFYYQSPVFLKTADGIYIYNEIVSDNDYCSMWWMNIESGDSGCVSNLGISGYYDEELGAGIDTLITDPYEMTLSSRLNTFSTTDGWKIYSTSVHGEPVSEDSEYIMCRTFDLTSKTELEVRILDEPYGEPDHDEKLPEGTVFTVYATDNHTFVEARTDSDVCCRIYGSFSWPQEVAGGYTAEEAFDGVAYAG